MVLGWLLLHETVDAYTLAGTVIIIGSVALVNTAQLKRASMETAPAEAADVPVAAGD